MNTTVGGISRMLGDNPDDRKVLYVAAQMMRENPSGYKNPIFELQVNMGLVAGCAGWHRLVEAIDTFTDGISKL